MPNKSWFNIQNRTTPNSEAEILIYDAIGAYGVTAKDFVKALNDLDAKRLIVRINSPGGEVFDGTAIYNALKEHEATVEVRIDGVAASAASVIAMAGDTITIAKNAYLMVHEAWGLVQGPADDMKKMSELLEKMNQGIAQTYADRTGKSADEWLGIMAEETWYLGQEAVDAGLADAVEETEAEPVKASFNYQIFNKIPEPLRMAWGVPKNTKQSPGLNELTVPRGIQPPAAPTEITPMNAEAFNKFAAENPAAVEPFIVQGYNKAKTELTPKAATVADLSAVFPDDSFCMAQLKAGATMADAHVAWAKTLGDKFNALQTENADLKNRLDLAGKGAAPLALGGGGAPPAEPVDPSKIEDPKLRAAAEWDANIVAENGRPCREGFESKENFVNFRAYQLAGNIRVINR